MKKRVKTKKERERESKGIQGQTRDEIWRTGGVGARREEARDHTR